ncbi:hypothetical protein NDU88_001144 [Pleurodeles waltl]|uniref:Uncharacterized protein n=1 Tax=Pleurodeles waltl TaxID=8319 RepID=A0AAV7Q292_PLEWA|nr:hypothetical protein NDU88_001144 [Pleurodeles waltl]
MPDGRCSPETLGPPTACREEDGWVPRRATGGKEWASGGPDSAGGARDWHCRTQGVARLGLALAAGGSGALRPVIRSGPGAGGLLARCEASASPEEAARRARTWTSWRGRGRPEFLIAGSGGLRRPSLKWKRAVGRRSFVEGSAVKEQRLLVEE